MNVAVAPPAVPASDPAPALAPPWAALIALAATLALLFGPGILALTRLWDTDPNYSHGYFIPFISAAIAYSILRKAGVPAAGEPRLGLVPLVLGVLLHSAALVVKWPPLDYLGLVCILRGVLTTVGGPAWASRFNFPLVFLFFMFPLPVTWTGYVALLLQDVVSRVAEIVLGAFFVVYRQGHTIHIAGMGQGLVVAEECSGLRQLIAFLAFAALYGYLAGRTVPRRVVLFLAAAPIAVAANVLRVILMNLGAYHFGTGWMGGFLHHTPILFSLPVGLLLFFLFDRFLSGLWRGPADPAATPEPAATPVETPLTVPAGVGRKLLAVAAGLAVAAVFGFALTRHLDAAGAATYPQLRGAFETLPLAVPGWQGQEQPEHKEQTGKRLGYVYQDLMSRLYVSDAGTGAYVYAVHTLDGEDRKHHPEICMRDVSGAPEDLSFRAEVPLAGTPDRVVQRFRFMTGSGRSTVMYYWTYTVQPTPDPTRTAAQRLHQRVGIDAPSVTVQVSTGAAGKADLDRIEKTFLPALDAAFRDRVLPPTAVIGHARLPIGLSRQ